MIMTSISDRPSASRARGGLACLATLLLLTPAAIEAQTPDPAAIDEDRSVLRVGAQAEVEVDPDRAVVSFAVETEAESAREAGEANARLMDQVMNAVQGTGVEGLRTETSGYNLTPRYQSTRSDMPRVIAGYTARNHLLVTLDDVEAVGRILDIALDAGANRVAGLRFEIREPQPHREEALRRAVATARAEAETVAGALGVRLGDPIEVEAGTSRPSGQPGLQFRGEVMAMADAPTTPVEAGRQTVTANVTIHYRIHP